MTLITQTQNTYAVVDQHLSWDDLGDIDLSLAFRSYYSSNDNLYSPTFKTTDLNLAVNDYKERISEEFHIPSEMRKAVEFWLKIYTLYSTQSLVIFDRLHPEIVYEVLDFRELFRKSRSLVAYELNRQMIVKRKINEYKNVLTFLSKKQNQKAKKMFPEITQNILKNITNTSHKHSFNEFKNNLHAQTGQRDNIIKGLLAAETYFPQIEKIFTSIGVPKELSRLSLVESSFNLKAHSSADAVGVWQFIKPTAKLFLHMDDKMRWDERLSPIKSSVAAAELLMHNYSLIGSWTYSVVAYNHGFKDIPKIKNKKPGSVLSLCAPKIKSSLGWASKNYYAEFLALLHAETYRELFYGEVPLNRSIHLAFESIQSPITALNFALNKNIPLKQFQTANPDIKNFKAVLPKGFSIAVPAEHSDFSNLIKRETLVDRRSVRKNRHNPG